jgi:hypothetical protein
MGAERNKKEKNDVAYMAHKKQTTNDFKCPKQRAVTTMKRGCNSTKAGAPRNTNRYITKNNINNKTRARHDKNRKNMQKEFLVSKFKTNFKRDFVFKR